MNPERGGGEPGCGNTRDGRRIEAPRKVLRSREDPATFTPMGRFSGWTLTWLVTSLLLGLSAAGIAILGAGEEGERFVIRWTGRASTVLFALSFSASAALRFWRSGATAWLRRNRRYLGVSFATSQTIHLLALAALASASSGFRSSVDMVTLIAGGGAYVFTFAMALTSSDAAVRRMGVAWHRLHRVGAWWIYAVLFFTVVPPIVTGPVHFAVGVPIVVALALRIAVRLRFRAEVAA